MFLHNKRALSNLIAYVLLIAMTIALSTLIYAWLKGYVSEPDIENCPDGVDVTITQANCILNSNLNIKVRNMGRYTIDGFIVRFDDKKDSNTGFYRAFNGYLGEEPLDNEDITLLPGEEIGPIDYEIGVDACNGEPCKNGNVTLVEVQPIYQGSSCSSFSIQKIFCSNELS